MATDLQSLVMAESSKPSSLNVRSRSRPARRRRGSSPTPSISSTGLPTPTFSPDGPSDIDLDDDVIEESSLSPFDARRITPTLHASLVSEILSLRRDIENRDKTIDSLELTLDESRIENDTLSEDLSRATREKRSLTHQIQLLEGGSSSAMTELARERDEAVSNITDVRKRLESAQKKARSREEEIDRTQTLWDGDREAWENERRNWERKVHVAEGRLKTVLNQVAAAQEAGSLQSHYNDGNEGIHEYQSHGTYNASGASNRRRTSVASLTSDDGNTADKFNNTRYSVISVAAGKADAGLSLAEELAFDEEEEEEYDDEYDDTLSPQTPMSPEIPISPKDTCMSPGKALTSPETPISPEALPEERRPISMISQSSYAASLKARRILGLSFERVESPLSHLSRLAESSVVYRDAGIQYSPPPSPELPAVKEEVIDIDDMDETPEMTDSSTLTFSVQMVSSSCQTVGELPSPPCTPIQPIKECLEPQMSSISTQTEPVSEEEPANKSFLSPGGIPMIAIHPPGSEPSSPRTSIVLPPQTKSVSVQVNISPVVVARSIAIQTEDISVDRCPIKLPASLLPSAIQDLPSQAEAKVENSNFQPYHSYPQPVPPPRSAKRDRQRILAKNATSTDKPLRTQPETVQAYPGNNDNGPLSEHIKSGIRRPPRSSSLFAGFSDDEGPKGLAHERETFTDDELLNRPFASYTLRGGKMVNIHSNLKPNFDELHIPEISEQPDIPKISQQSGYNVSSSGIRRSLTSSYGDRQAGIRKMAMAPGDEPEIRGRSPSEPSMTSSGSVETSIKSSTSIKRKPPFPVPTRGSSRNVPLSGSDEPPTPTRFTKRNFGAPTVVRRPTLRRVQSEATTAHSEIPERPETLSSPGSSPVLDDLLFVPPPIPSDSITTPHTERQRQRLQKRPSQRRPSAQGRPSMNMEREEHEQREWHDSAGGVQPTSVVDAIAQTMVGEWMFKYVRRRKSFGMGESKDSWEGRNPDEVSASITNSGSRHKRWVWLAPYEGSIMWSNKQPTSGPALLGKSGRKFTIQSVLDVKDDNPLPKGSTSPAPFNRSILVLTPQRALKFTAMTVERHYVWLTALSFLSHSSVGLHELASIPPAPKEEAKTPTPSRAALRRIPIRDSIRVAKSRPRPLPGGRKMAHEPMPELPIEERESLDMAADAPHVPRFSSHARKRSYTSPRPPLQTLRSFSSQGTVLSSHSGTTAGSDPYASAQPPIVPTGYGSAPSTISRCTSEGSHRTSNTAGAGNMFDIGTVRMEAFIDPHTDMMNRSRPRPIKHRRKASSQWSQPRDYAPSVVDSENSFRRDDPFRGF